MAENESRAERHTETAQTSSGSGYSRTWEEIVCQGRSGIRRTAFCFVLFTFAYSSQEKSCCNSADSAVQIFPLNAL